MFSFVFSFGSLTIVSICVLGCKRCANFEVAMALALPWSEEAAVMVFGDSASGLSLRRRLDLRTLDAVAGLSGSSLDSRGGFFRFFLPVGGSVWLVGLVDAWVLGELAECLAAERVSRGDMENH